MSDTPVAAPGDAPGAKPRIWIDVGSHLGEKTFAHAAADPALRVYAFEPNLRIACRTIGRLPNFVVIPMAVAEQDGCADFYLNRFAAASSLLPFNPEGLARWVDGDLLAVEQRLTVSTTRLDTFLEAMGIEAVEFLKIDAQGADLAVVRSAGNRLRDVERIALEVQVNAVPLYAGGSEKQETIGFLEKAGFVLEASEAQSHGQELNLVFSRRRPR